MGKKDAYQFDYLDDNGRFADQINGALFNGRQVIKPEELEPEEAQTVSTGAGTVKTIVDKVRIWKGKKLHILAVENQNYMDYQMVLRTMLSESAGYRKQWKRKKRLHEKAHDLKNRDNSDSDTRDMLEVVANIKIPEACKIPGDEEGYDMCKAFEDMRQEGYDEGIEKGIRALVEICAELGISKDVIIEKCAEKYELTEEHAREYVEANYI